METDLKKIPVYCYGVQTAEELINSVPESSKQTMKEAIFKCMKENLPLIHPHIYEIARELNAEKERKRKWFHKCR